MSSTHSYSGECHCGALRAVVTLPRPAAEQEVRSCQCSFCVRHGSRTVSDPQGHVRFELDPGSLIRYRMGTGTIDFLICARCGTYVGALLEEGGRHWSVTNARGLAIMEFARESFSKTNYDAETLDQRMARRKSRWTPTEVKLVGRPTGKPAAGKPAA